MKSVAQTCEKKLGHETGPEDLESALATGSREATQTPSKNQFNQLILPY